MVLRAYEEAITMDGRGGNRASDEARFGHKRPASAACGGRRRRVQIAALATCVGVALVLSINGTSRVAIPQVMVQPPPDTPPKSVVAGQAAGDGLGGPVDKLTPTASPAAAPEASTFGGAVEADQDDHVKRAREKEELDDPRAEHVHSKVGHAPAVGGPIAPVEGLRTGRFHGDDNFRAVEIPPTPLEQAVQSGTVDNIMGKPCGLSDSTTYAPENELDYIKTVSRGLASGQFDCVYRPTPATGGGTGPQAQCCCSASKAEDATETCLPTFLIIGAQKSGSTALFGYFLHHPMIRPPARKEMHFFDFRARKLSSIAKYVIGFPEMDADHRPEETITGETTPSYILSIPTSAQLRSALPDARLLLVVRHPVDRAYSEYQMKLRRIDAAFDAHDFLLEGDPPLLPHIRRCWEEHVGSPERRRRLATETAISELPSDAATTTGEAAQSSKGSGDSIGFIRRPQSAEATTPTKDESRPSGQVPKSGTSPAPRNWLDAAGAKRIPRMSPKNLPYTQCIESAVVAKIKEEELELQLAPGRSARSLTRQCFGEGRAISDKDSTAVGALGPCIKTNFRPPETVAPMMTQFQQEMEQIKRCSQPTPSVGDAARRAGVDPFVSWDEADEAAQVGSDDEGVRFQWGTKSCWRLGSNSNIKEDFLIRSLYAPQLIRYRQLFPKHQIMVISDTELKEMSQDVLDRAFEFVGLPSVDVTNVGEKEIHDMISVTFPKFEDSSGWRIRSDYQPMSPNVRQSLVEMFKPFNREFFHLIGRRFDEWDE